MHIVANAALGVHSSKGTRISESKMRGLIQKMLGKHNAAPEPVRPAPVLINAYCTVTCLPAPTFPHTLVGMRDQSDPSLTEHLQGFVGYVASRGDGTMTPTRYHVIRHIQRTQHQLSFTMTPDHWAALASWADGANAILFLPDGNVCDPQGRPLVTATDGRMHPDARLPYPASARQRKQRSEELISQRGLRAPTHLPPLVSEDEVNLRSETEVLQRARALFLVAVTAESSLDNARIEPSELRDAYREFFSGLSPAEHDYLDGTPDEQQSIQMVWRYECLSLLEWTLRLTPELRFPDAICDVPAAARTVIEYRPQTTNALKLRPASDILDALDLTYRLHWIIRQARIDGGPMPPGMDAGVIMERHYALNWLIRHENCEWDEVDTPT